MATDRRYDDFAATPSIPKHVIGRKKRFSIDLPVDSLQAAFVSFNDAAEAFSISLSDPMDRKFACRYLIYLQGIVRGSESSKPYSTGRPSWSLICRELERLFRSHFSRPDQRKPDSH
jgi:hypothetical protein